MARLDQIRETCQTLRKQVEDANAKNKQAEESNEELEAQLKISQATLECRDVELEAQKKLVERIRTTPRSSLPGVASSSSQTEEHLHKRIKELERALKVEERLRKDAAVSALSRETELEEENEELKTENQKLKEMVQKLTKELNDRCQPPPSPIRHQEHDDEDQGQGGGDEQRTEQDRGEGSQQDKGKTQEQDKGQEKTQAGSSKRTHKEQLRHIIQLTQIEAEKEIQELQQQVLTEKEEHWKAAMEWEIKVINSINVHLLQPRQISEEWYTRDLPYPILKMETLKRKIRIKEQMVEEGSHEGEQPQWRKEWLRQNPEALLTFRRAPREYQEDVTYCPMLRSIPWSEFEEAKKRHPTWLNYPALPSPLPEERINERYMIRVCTEAAKVFEGMPDITCQMLRKICKMLLTCITMYHRPELADTPWMSYLEGNQGLAYDMSQQPSKEILYGLFARVIFLPSYFLNTFEEAFYTGFFTFDTHIFAPEMRNLRARFVAYQAMEQQSQIFAQESSTMDKETAAAYTEGLNLLIRRRQLRRLHVRDDMN